MLEVPAHGNIRALKIFTVLYGVINLKLLLANGQHIALGTFSCYISVDPNTSADICGFVSCVI